MKKLFKDINISWEFIIIFSILIGLLVGIINRIPILNNTSFQDIAIVLDMWIIFAIFIIVNCNTWKEAVCKCFIFFLISQPLIYFTEILLDVIIYHKDFTNLFTLYFKNYYIGSGWLTLTFLTIPGSFIAYQIKKDNVLSSIILSVATGYLAFSGTTCLIECIFNHFPYHLLNGLICLFMAFMLIFLILKNKKNRVISLIITIIGIILGITFLMCQKNNPMLINEIVDFEDNMIIVDYTVENEDIAHVSLSDDGKYMDVSSSSKVGSTKIIVKDESNKEYTYIVNSTSKEFTIELQK